MKRSLWMAGLSAGLLLAACASEVTSQGGSGGGATTSSGPTTSGPTTSNGGSGGSAGVAVGGRGGGTTTSATGGSGGIDCNPTTVACDGPTPQCPPGEVPEVINGCWGSCVPILSCRTEPNCNNCQGGFCAEYVAFVTEYRCVMPTLMCSALACGCLAPYFCVAPYDACSEMAMDGEVSCGCPTC